jgi:LacI family transcriptional regulator
VIIPNILNSFFASFSGIEKVMEGIQVMCISNESADKEAHTLEMLSNGTIDGFIVSVSESKEKSRLRSFLSDCDGTPIVFDQLQKALMRQGNCR